MTSFKKFLILALCLTILSVVSWVIYFSMNLTLTYNDAKSHLDVSRRIIDSLQPGIAQLGSVWLPLTHVLYLTFIWNDFFWHTGIAGSIFSMISFVAGGIFIYGLTRELKYKHQASIVSVLVYALNPNLLYMQTTPMTEAIIITFSLGAVYFLIRWAKTFELHHLIISSFFVFLATLTRYDGWFLFIAAVLAVLLIGLKEKNFKFVQANLLVFCSLAGFGIFLWFLWNLVVLGNPLYFANGPFSAKAQQDILLSEGKLLTPGDWPFSILIYFEAAKYNIGLLLSILAIVGSLIFYFSRSYLKKVKLVISLLLVPFFFNIVSLGLGHSVLQMPSYPPYYWFNIRYGLMVLPAAAIFIGALVRGKTAAYYFVIAVIALQTYLIYSTGEIVTIQDGVFGRSSYNVDKPASWLGQNAKDGLILASASSIDSILFKSNIHLSRFITEGASKYWKDSLMDPTMFATWVVFNKGDTVYKSMRDNPNFLNHFELAYDADPTYIYRHNPGKKEPLSKEDTR